MLFRSAKEGSDAAVAAAKGSMESEASAAGLPVVTDTGTLPSARFGEATGRRDLVVAEESRLSDLVMFSGSEIEDGIAGGDALEGALMSADRPVLIAPKSAATSIGDNDLVGWDGSLQASAAGTAAVQFIEKASKRTHACIDEGVEAGCAK